MALLAVQEWNGARNRILVDLALSVLSLSPQMSWLCRYFVCAEAFSIGQVERPRIE